jgi:hypothetical protein
MLESIQVIFIVDNKHSLLILQFYKALTKKF